MKLSLISKESFLLAKLHVLSPPLPFPLGRRLLLLLPLPLLLLLLPLLLLLLLLPSIRDGVYRSKDE